MTTEASRFVLEPDDIQQPADPRNSKCKSPDRTPQRSRRSSVSSPAGGTPVSALRGQVCTPHNHENVPTPQGAQVVEESDIPIITYEDIPIHNDDALVMSMGVDIDNSITVSLPQQSSASIVRPLRSASTVRVVWSDPPKRSLMPWLQRPSTSTGQYESYQQGTNALPLHSHASSASLAEPKRGDVSSHHGSSSTSRRARLLMNPLAVKGLGKSLDCQSPLHFSHIASRRDRGTSSLPSQNAYRRRSRTSTPILGGRNNARFSRTGLSEQHDNVLPGESTAHRSSYLGEVGGFPGRMGSISVLARKTPHESMAGRKGGENGRERIDEAGSVEMSLAKIFQKTLPGNGAHTCKSVQIAAKRASGRRKGQRLASPQPNTVARCGGLYGFLNRYSCDFTSLSGKDVEALLPVELSSDLFSTCSPYTPFAFQKLGASPLQQDADLAVLFSPGIFNNSQPNTGLQPSDFDKYMSQYALIDSPSPLHNGDTFATVDSPASPIDHVISVRRAWRLLYLQWTCDT
jgi:hypothetical protein